RQNLVSVSNRRFIYGQHMSARALDFLQAKISGGLFGANRFDAVQTLQHCASRLCLFRFLAGEIAPDELFGLGDQTLMIVISALLNLAPLFTLDKIIGVVPLVTRRAPEFHLDDSPTGPIQTITIV